jgi:hypothetical protein
MQTVYWFAEEEVVSELHAFSTWDEKSKVEDKLIPSALAWSMHHGS